MIRHFKATGRVQGVMFRQTLIRGAAKRDLQAGATNDRDGRTVSFALKGDPEKIDEVVELLRSRKPLNDWGARVESVRELDDDTRSIDDYQVTTENVDRFAWNPNVDMYL